MPEQRPNSHPAPYGGYGLALARASSSARSSLGCSGGSPRPERLRKGGHRARATRRARAHPRSVRRAPRRHGIRSPEGERGNIRAPASSDLTDDAGEPLSRTRSAPRRAALLPHRCSEQPQPGQTQERHAFSTDSATTMFVRPTGPAASMERAFGLLGRLRPVRRSSRAGCRGPAPAAAPQPGLLPTSGCRG
jgi:hypothetical protein